MPRKPLTPEQAAESKEKRRQYQREYKRRQRASEGHVEKRSPDKRKRDRAEYMREYRRKKKEGLID